MKKNKAINIIEKESKIWQEAYPKQKGLLSKFTQKIKLELNLQGA